MNNSKFISPALRRMAKRQTVKYSEIQGVILLNKPLGISSNHALQRVKRCLNARKAGHTGSLDPLATGLLPICLGRATKFSHFLLNADKGYDFTVKFGETTSTGDAEGEVVDKKPIPENLNIQQIEQACESLRGDINQVPPMFSALKHKGKPLYQLARKGIKIDRPARPVKIYSLQIVELRGDQCDFKVRCSKGTYVRTLAEDIGNFLGCGGHVIKLHRSSVAGLAASGMVTLDDFEQDSRYQRSSLLDISCLVDHLPAIYVSFMQLQKLQIGKKIILPLADESIRGQQVRLLDNSNQCVGVGEWVNDSQFKAVRLINYN